MVYYILFNYINSEKTNLTSSDIESKDENIITIEKGKLNVPNNPTIPFIEGDGIGADVWRASRRVLDAAVKKAYSNERTINWIEALAGEKAFNQTGQWLPGETLEMCKKYLVAIKGPLTTPIGGGFRSLNVTLRQVLDLYVCIRPVRWFNGVPSPVKEPKNVDMVIFRENTEDIYAGIEFEEGTAECKKFLSLIEENFQILSRKLDSLKHQAWGLSRFHMRAQRA